MITHATAGDDCPVPRADRERWLAMLDETTVCGACGCGLCPSVEFAYQGIPVDCASPRIVLGAGTTRKDALVLLFIDGGKPSYLEVCPVEDDPVTMPDAEELVFT